MSVFVHKHSRVIIQGLTGQHATFHAEESMKNGTTVVGGVTPGKGGEWFDPGDNTERIPVYDTVKTAVEHTGANASISYRCSRKDPSIIHIPCHPVELHRQRCAIGRVG